MGANFGLEHALWFAPEGMEPTETPTYRRSEAFAIVREECQAVRRRAGLYETTNYGKFEVTGRGARAWLDRVFASRIPQPGRLGLAPMLNPQAASSATFDRVPGDVVFLVGLALPKNSTCVGSGRRNHRGCVRALGSLRLAG
jgi:hypothetical protein